MTPVHFGDERLPTHFWEKAMPELNSGCWLWLGAASNGYGGDNLRFEDFAALLSALQHNTGERDS